MEKWGTVGKERRFLSIVNHSVEFLNSGKKFGIFQFNSAESGCTLVVEVKHTLLTCGAEFFLLFLIVSRIYCGGFRIPFKAGIWGPRRSCLFHSFKTTTFKTTSKGLLKPTLQTNSQVDKVSKLQNSRSLKM